MLRTRMRLLSILAALAASILLCLLSFSPALASSVGSAQGRISGQLLDGSRANAPLAGQTVTLQKAQGNSSQDAATATTDAHGFYSFNNLATDKTINYAIYIRYQGAQYLSNIVTLASKPQQQVNLTVYDATSDTSKVAIVQATVLIQTPDSKKGTFTVSEYFDFKNLDTHTFVGSLDTSKGKPKALFFSLPQGARNISLTRGFDGYKSTQIGTGFASTAALPPGDSEFAFSFDVPYTASTYDFRYVAMYPTVQLSFLVPPELHATTGALSAQGLMTADQHPFQLFKGNGLLTNQEVHVGLDGLPTVPPPSTTTSFETNTIWLVVIILLMLAVVGITWSFYRARRRQATQIRQRKGAKKGGKSATDKADTAKATSTMQDREQALLRELLDLDKAYEAGKLSESVYKERRAKTKARLRSLMSERETSRR